MRRDEFKPVRRFRWGLWSRRRDIDEELAFHLETAADELEATGMDRAQARREAARRFGSVNDHRDACRQVARRRQRVVDRMEILQRLAGDVRLALRTFRRSPGFTAVVVLTLALGIGANTAMFSIIDGVLLEPLPFPDAHELVAVGETNPDRGWTFANAAPANFLDWRAQSTLLDDITLVSGGVGVALSGDDGDARWVEGARVYANFFDVLGVTPVKGRGFIEEESWSGGPWRVVISHRLWRNRLGERPDIVGSTLTLDGDPVEVIGVAPPGFAYPTDDIEFWLPTHWPLAAREQIWFRRAHMARAVGRLANGVSVQAAESELRTIATRLEERYPETNTNMGVAVKDLRDWRVGSSRTQLLLLLGAVSLVLLIACANIACLLLARAAGRLTEFAVRTALGAGRLQIVRQLMVENTLMAALGGGLGWLLAIAAIQSFPSWAPADLPRPEAVDLDGEVLVFTVVTTLGTSLIFGLLPAWLASRSQPARMMNVGSRQASGAARSPRLRGALVVVEIALSVLLVVGAGLMTRSLFRILAVDPGFDPRGALAVALEAPDSRYADGAQVEAFFGELLESVSALPGVVAVSAADTLPLTGTGWTSDFSVEGSPDRETGVEFNRRLVAPGYFQTMGVELIRGREFRTGDTTDAPPVVIVNKTLARRYFPDRDPVGVRVAIEGSGSGDEPIWRTIVGVVEDEKLQGLRAESWPEMFLPLGQEPVRYRHIIARVTGDPLDQIPAIRSLVHARDPAMPLVRSRALTDLVSGSVERDRFLAGLLLAFALMALLLANVGIYGLMAHMVGQRTHEIGVRLALGAGRFDIIGLFLGHGLRLVSAGLALGIVGGLAFGRLLRSQLFGVSPSDPATLLAVACLLAGIAVLATWLPARRATRVDPMVALRVD